MNEKRKIRSLLFDANFDCIICLNSKIPSLGFFLQFKELPIIAADGGAVRLFEIGILPDCVVGDLDTFDASGVGKFFNNVEIVREPSQEINDFEKSLNFAIHKGFRNILIIGFQGGELEHTLNNWSILIKFTDLVNLCIYDLGRYGIPLTHSVKVDVTKDEVISIIPQPFCNITTQNLRWNLRGENLKLGIREGARNVAESNSILIELNEGSFLLFLDARLPFCYRKELWTR